METMMLGRDKQKEVHPKTAEDRATAAEMRQPTPLHDMPGGEEALGDGASKGSLATQGNREVQAYDFGDDAGAGMENVDKSEMKLIWVDVLQSNSPQLDEGSPKYNASAKAGMFVDNMGRLYDGKKGLPFVPAYRDHNYVEFIPRNLGGGFQGFYPIGDSRINGIIADINKRAGKPANAQVFGKISTATKWSQDGLPLDGTEFTETFYLFGTFVPEDEAPFIGGIRFKSTQIGKYQNFVTTYRGFRYNTPKGPQEPPIWAHLWRLTTGPESNKKGKFHGINIRLNAQNDDGSQKDKSFSLLRQDDPLYITSKELYRQMSGGTLRADYAAAEAAAGDGKGGTEEDIPM